MTQAWIRPNPTGTTVAAAYLTIISPIPDTLVGVSVPASVAGSASLHRSSVVTSSSGMSSTTMSSTTMSSTSMSSTSMAGTGGSDQMQMTPVASIPLPAGKAVVLEPGGYHIMLMDLVKQLKAGDHVALTLRFARAGTRTVTATVREG